ncbi:hypothetical protein Bxe_A3545 [Paraburkholderia xenovorans LB400]|uniref:Uncharacterized protein n=1 Tax=Paraburkholderia xenovorans (strain LB400) TaxID=266265 RepID=Q143P6_PARXL|nr:hypothetical protein Bxe_A3545 [Paraburkholderia xenovorans LB400]
MHSRPQRDKLFVDTSFVSLAICFSSSLSDSHRPRVAGNPVRSVSSTGIYSTHCSFIFFRCTKIEIAFTVNLSAGFTPSRNAFS